MELFQEVNVIILAPLISFIVSWFFYLICSGKNMIALSHLGKASLEILMISDLFNIYFDRTIISERVTALIIFIVVIPIGLIYHRVIEKLKQIAKETLCH